MSASTAPVGSADPRPRGKPLAELARAAGIQTSYYGTDGRRHRASAETLLAVLRALGVEVEDREDAARARAELQARRGEALVPPVVVAWDGRGEVAVSTGPGPVELTVALEDGGEMTGRVEARAATEAPRTAPEAGPTGRAPLPGPLPLGVHRLHVRAAGREATACVLAAPRRRAASTVARAARFGVFAPTYALWQEAADTPWTGHLGDLDRLARWTGEQGGALVATLPLLPTYLGAGQEPFEPSPYAPVSRLAWSEAYLDPAVAPIGPAAGGRPDDAELVDWRRRGERVRIALDAAMDARGDAGRAEVDRWVADRPEVAAYARFRAATERHGPWPAWPQRWRDGDLAGADVDDAAEARHRFGQWAADQQLAGLADRLAGRGQLLYLDLPIGAHPEGFDTWRHQRAFAPATTVGAPPDDFFTAGQDWGFPPLHPEASRRDGHAYLRASLAHHLRHARMLRIDHVMAVHRLWWVPQGFPADQGAYVRYPADELYAAIALEAERAGAEVVGEDLGTVPKEVRRALARHGLLGMYAAQFTLPARAGDVLPPPRRRDLALLNTHDMATFAAFWQGDDVDRRRSLGLLDGPGATAEHAERADRREAVVAFLAERGRPVDPDDTEAVLRALLEELGTSSARWVLVALEDLWLEHRPQNVPGLGPDRYPSWRRRTARPVDRLDTTPAPGHLAALHAARGGRS